MEKKIENTSMRELDEIDQINAEIVEAIEEQERELAQETLENREVEECGIDEEQPKKTQEQEVLDFKTNPENQQNALYLASQIEHLVGKNWFTLLRLQNKAKLNQKEAYDKLSIIKLFDLVTVKLGDFRDAKENVKVPMYKIVISKESKIQALEQIIQYHKDQIQQFEIQKSLL